MEDLIPTCRYFYEDYNEQTHGTETQKYKCQLYDEEKNVCSITKKKCGLYS